MKNINDYLIESSNKKEKSKAHKSFQEYFDNFDFNLIPVSERNKDVEDYEDIAKTSKMATEASLEDDVIIESNNNGEIKSVSQIVEELKVKYNKKREELNKCISRYSKELYRLSEAKKKTKATFASHKYLMNKLNKL